MGGVHPLLVALRLGLGEPLLQLLNDGIVPVGHEVLVRAGGALLHGPRHPLNQRPALLACAGVHAVRIPVVHISAALAVIVQAVGPRGVDDVPVFLQQLLVRVRLPEARVRLVCLPLPLRFLDELLRVAAIHGDGVLRRIALGAGLTCAGLTCAAHGLVLGLLHRQLIHLSGFLLHDLVHGLALNRLDLILT